VFATPRNEVELQRIMKTASLVDGPFAYRYPRGNGVGLPLATEIETLEVGRGELLCAGSDGLIIAVGDMVNEALVAARHLSVDGFDLAVIDARFIKPLDEVLILSQIEKVPFVITAEENSLQGGFGASILELMSDAGLSIPVVRIGIPDHFIGQGTQTELRNQLGLNSDGIIKRVLQAAQFQKTKATAS
jgi:1-deoxy-D-xylulose-5-phosphate synthase